MAAKTKLQNDVIKTQRRVATILGNQLAVNENEIVIATDIRDLGASSLDCVEITSAVEEEFDCSVPDEQMESIKTVRGIIFFVLHKVQGNDLEDVNAAIESCEAGTEPRPAEKANVLPLVSGEAPRVFLDNLAEYKICQTPRMEFSKLFNHVFGNPELAMAARYTAVGDSDAWCIRMSTRLDAEGVDAVYRIVEEAGFAFLKTTEHLVQLPGEEIRFAVVTHVHVTLTTYTRNNQF